MVKSAEKRMRSNLELLPVINVKSRPRYISALTKSRPRYISEQKIDGWIWNQNIAISTIVGTSSHIIYKIKKNRENNFVCERNVQNFPIHVIRALYIDVSL
jgi:hypothetical protein